MNRLCVVTTALALLATGLLGQPGRQPDGTLDTALATARQDLESAQHELEVLRERVSAERIPLRGELLNLTDAVRQLRRETAAIADTGHQEARTLERKRAEARQLEDDLRFLGDLFMEYRRSIETRVAAGEAGNLRQRLARLDAETAGDAADQAPLPEVAAAIAEAAIQAQRARVGGFRGDGTLVAADGTEQAARLVAIGPVSYGVTTDDDTAGIAVSRPGLLVPGLYTGIPDGAQAAIRSLLAGERATVPLDVTPQGDAMRAAGHRRTFADELRSGGFVMFPLVAVGLTALFVTLWKLLEMRRICVQDDRAMDGALDALRRHDTAAALAAADHAGAPLGALLRDAIGCRDAPREHIEEILHEHIVAGIPRLERHLGTLAVLGGIAPLLGLLGTVTGMMHTFQLVTLFGTGEARLLSGGISEALITTKFGLSIAIPVLLAHALLARQVRTCVGRLETSAVKFVNRLKQDGPPHA